MKVLGDKQLQARIVKMRQLTSELGEHTAAELLTPGGGYILKDSALIRGNPAILSEAFEVLAVRAESAAPLPEHFVEHQEGLRAAKHVLIPYRSRHNQLNSDGTLPDFLDLPLGLYAGATLKLAEKIINNSVRRESPTEMAPFLPPVLELAGSAYGERERQRRVDTAASIVTTMAASNAVTGDRIITALTTEPRMIDYLPESALTAFCRLAPGHRAQADAFMAVTAGPAEDLLAAKKRRFYAEQIQKAAYQRS